MPFALSMYRGDTEEIKITAKRNNNAVNITGAQVTFSAKKWVSDTTYLIQRTAVLVDPTNGVAVATLQPIDTASLPEDIILNCDVEVIEIDGRTSTIRGTLLVTADIKR